MAAMVRSISDIRAMRDHERLRRLQADFARRGLQLDPVIDSKLLVQFKGLHTILPSLDAAERFLEDFGGTP